MEIKVKLIDDKICMPIQGFMMSKRLREFLTKTEVGPGVHTRQLFLAAIWMFTRTRIMRSPTCLCPGPVNMIGYMARGNKSYK
jgi:hypothetical protein